MAWLIQVLEIADQLGKPTGTYRLTATSDEDGGGPYPMCTHTHATRDAADDCPEAIYMADSYL